MLNDKKNFTINIKTTVSITRFLLSKTFFKHLGIMVVATILLLWLVFLMLGVYTHHGETVEVPNFKGKTIEALDQFAEENHVRYEITDSVYNIKLKRGTVAEQNPPAKFKVKSGRVIYLTMNAKLP